MKGKIYKKKSVPAVYIKKWQDIVDLLAMCLNVPSGLIMRADSRALEVLIANQSEENPFQQGEKLELTEGIFFEKVMDCQSLFFISNALEDSLWRDNPNLNLKMIAYMGLPLIWPDGSIFGVMGVMDKKKRDFSDADTEMFRKFKEMIEGDFKILEKQRKELKRRLRVEDELRASKEKFTRVFLKSPEVMSVSTLEEGLMVDVNEGFIRTLGYTREELIGHTSLELGLWKNPQDRSKMLAKLKKDNRFHAMEVEIVRKGGEVLTCLISGEVIELEGKLRLVIIINDITERKRAEEALRESENRYRALFNAANDAIFIMKGKYFINCNQKALEMYGCKMEDIINHTPFDFSPPQQPDGSDSEVKGVEKIEAALAGNLQYFEWLHTRLDGTPFYAEVSLSRLELSTGEHLLVFVRDITERKKMEENLKQKQAQQELILRSLPMAFYIAYPYGDYGGTWVSDQIDTISGFTAEEFLEDTNLWFSRLHPDDKEYTLERFNSLKYKGDLTVEYRWKAKNGKYIWLSDQAVLIRDERNNPKELIGTWLDITERKLVEKKFQENEERLRKIFEESPFGMVLVDRSYQFIKVNPAICEMLGYTEEELKCLTFLDITYPDDLPNNIEMARNLFNNKIPSFQMEKRYISRFNELVWVKTTASTIRDNLGKIIYGLAIIENITEKKKSEQKEKEYQEQLMHADKMVSLGTLVSGVAHEINNPNNAIMFNAPLLQEVCDELIPLLDEKFQQAGDFEVAGLAYSELKSSVKELFDGIIRSTDRIKNIVSELKSFARPDSYDLNQEVNINQVVKTSLNLMQNMIKKSTHHFSIVYEKEIPLVCGNFQRLEQVVINLVQNACQALEDKSQAIKISTLLDKKDNCVKISVEDEGIGIDTDSIKFITDPFFTTRRQQGGTGLGLSVSARIIRDHNGTLQINSKPGEGSQFTVLLPIDK